MLESLEREWHFTLLFSCTNSTELRCPLRSKRSTPSSEGLAKQHGFLGKTKVIAASQLEDSRSQAARSHGSRGSPGFSGEQSWGAEPGSSQILPGWTQACRRAGVRASRDGWPPRRRAVAILSSEGVIWLGFCRDLHRAWIIQSAYFTFPEEQMMLQPWAEKLLQLSVPASKSDTEPGQAQPEGPFSVAYEISLLSPAQPLTWLEEDAEGSRSSWRMKVLERKEMIATPFPLPPKEKNEKKRLLCTTFGTGGAHPGSWLVLLSRANNCSQAMPCTLTSSSDIARYFYSASPERVKRPVVLGTRVDFKVGGEPSIKSTGVLYPPDGEWPVENLCPLPSRRATRSSAFSWSYTRE